MTYKRNYGTTLFLTYPYEDELQKDLAYLDGQAEKRLC